MTNTTLHTFGKIILKYLIYSRYFALLVFLLLAGCGVDVIKINTDVPKQPPPGEPPPSAGQSGSVSISPQYAALAPGQTGRFQATVQGGAALTWLINGIQGGNSDIGTIDATGNYTAPTKLSLSANVTVTAAAVVSPQTNFATAVASIIDPGVVTATANPQVATYSIYLPAPGKVSIDFGSDTDYGLATWAQTTPSPNGGEVSIYVAGMRAQTLYHMRAQVVLDNGAGFTDNDRTFTTGTPPATAPVSISTSGGQPPQAGIEMFDTLIPQESAQAFATDLQGNVIWTYSYTDGTKMDAIQPIKLLPNGHFLVLISYASSIALKGAQILPNTVDAVREVDLAGNTIRGVTQNDLVTALVAKGYSLDLGSLHHDVLALPNGHWILLATVSQAFSNLTGYPRTTNVLGDVLIDIDQNNQPVWVWNAFDHLDVNRHPYLFPDWTHTNSVLYSTDDHDLLLSVRHQNWIIKIDYADGQGSGRILWRLGEGGDFKLLGGTDPTDWSPGESSAPTAGRSYMRRHVMSGLILLAPALRARGPAPKN
jgi:arylsulfate sulfotransferase